MISGVKANKQEKIGLRATYKQLRNKAINQMRTDTRNQNADRLTKAKNEGEVWKIVNEIIKPKSSPHIVLNTNDGELTDDLEIANKFNEYFIQKIEDLKEKIDPTLIKDPLARIHEKNQAQEPFVQPKKDYCKRGGENHEEYVEEKKQG